MQQLWSSVVKQASLRRNQVNRFPGFTSSTQRSLVQRNKARDFSSMDDAPKTVLYRVDLVDALSEEHDLSKAKADRIVGSILDTIVQTVGSKGTVRLSNFGSFSSSVAAARSGRNPSTGETIHIPETNRIKFKPYPAFKDHVNGK